MTTPRLGVDIGNVIMAGDNDALFGPVGSYSEERMLAIPEVDDAASTINRLVRLFGSENVWLVSKAHKNTEAKTLRWLEHRAFCGRTAILPRHIWFCRERPEKAIICQILGIAHFVDDRADVLAPMTGIVPHRYLFGHQIGALGITPVPDWTATEQAIRANFPVPGVSQ